MIEVAQIGKSFKGGSILSMAGSSMLANIDEVIAVKSVSFSCKAGTVLGLIGPNGAGKTTTLRMLSGALALTNGSITVHGKSVAAMKAAERRYIGFLSGNTGLYARLTVRENLAYFGTAYGLDKATLEKRITELIAGFGLATQADKLVDTLSFGNKQRAAIARSVIHSPSILILDEPTTGLDLLGAKLVLDFIKAQRDDGVAVIFSSHNMQEIETLCDSVCVIAGGMSRFEGTIAALMESVRATTLIDAYHGVVQKAGN